ncbi:hypothetical protein C2W62_38500 [Candidatus Entotheonella serta]|nr:hypothetical protein C2W62_38500 [Candidatus Entotheonella serta]
MLLELALAAGAIYGVTHLSKKPRHLGQFLAQQTKPNNNVSQSSSTKASTTLPALESFTSQQPRHPILRLLDMTYMKPKRLIAGGLTSIAGIFATLLTIFLLPWLFQVVILGRSNLLMRLGLVGLRAQLSFIGVGLVLAYGINTLIEHVQRKKWQQSSRTLEHRIHVQTVSHVQHLDLAHIEDQRFEDQRSGRLMQILSNDTSQIQQFFQSGVNDGIRALSLLLLLGAVLFFLSPMLILLTLLPQPLFLVWIRRLQKRNTLSPQDLVDKTDDLHHLLTNNLAGLHTVKSFTAEAFEIDRIATASEVVRQYNIDMTAQNSAGVSLMRFLFLSNLGTLFTCDSYYAAIAQSTSSCSGQLRSRKPSSYKGCLSIRL